ncbi:Galactose oxidase/kelch repeat superfamily protein, putative isoform 2 [Hibiscus syriacus]|uniref:Galactose oxidase/kelch repeat superfamily protein, putative isoform 2 n=1 Tax=Hibiscus syriacus TaxID=106335 RepID=A0A6A2YKH9_HIBSY|nr:Galactose oxidase/kelch repeat superfamily protein, putative isoform 2 [Hibiscus syriacus]
MESFGAQMAKRKAMWLYPKVSGCILSERWGILLAILMGLYMFWGQLGCCGGLHFGDVLMLNLNTMVWKTLETTGRGPGPRDSHSVVLSGRAECNGAAPSPRESHTATLIGDDKVVIFGGSGEGGANYLNDLHVLDLRTMTWTSPQVRGHIPVPRDSHSAVAIGNSSLYMVGTAVIGTTEMSSSTWMPQLVKGSVPGVRAGHAAVNVGAMVAHFALHVNACSWTQLDICGQLPQGRFSHAAVLAESDIAIYGGCGEDERPINELLVLQLGTQHPNGRYNISMCKTFGGHWNQEKRRFLRVAPTNSQKGIYFTDIEVVKHGDNEPDQEAKHSSRFNTDHIWFTKLERFGIYKRISKPSKTGTISPRCSYEQTEKWNAMLGCGSRAYSQPGKGPQILHFDGISNFNSCSVRFPSFHPSCRVFLLSQLGAEVRGKVDGAFDSGLLVTATANGKIFRGVLFAPVSLVSFIVETPSMCVKLFLTISLFNQTLGDVGFRPERANARSKSVENTPGRCHSAFSKLDQFRTVEALSSTTMCIMPESGRGSRHSATNGTAKDPKLRSDAGDVVLTLGGPGTGPV